MPYESDESSCWEVMMKISQDSTANVGFSQLNNHLINCQIHKGHLKVRLFSCGLTICTFLRHLLSPYLIAAVDARDYIQTNPMDIEPRRYLAKELRPHPVSLKEVPPTRRKEVHQMGDKMNALIIDYGSENIKAGYEWSNEGPELVFRPQISKNRDPNKSDLPIKTYVNTSYDQLDFAKNNYKSPYQRNLVLHFSLFEQCNDYIFSELARPNRKLRCPLIITEPFANPIHCRNSVLQQLFECYEIESVMVGIDALFAYFYEVDCNLARYQSETALVINIGATTIHVLAIVKGKVDWSSVRRLNIGGNSAFQLFGKSISLKHPQLRDKLTYGFLRDIYEKFTCIAIDYQQQLRYFINKFKSQTPSNAYRNRIDEANRLIHEELTFIEGVEIDFDTIIEVPEQQIRRKEQVRKRMSEKLKETLARRKEMKRKMNEIQLKNYLDLKERYEAHDKFAHEEVVEMFGEHKPHDKLEKKIRSIEVKLGLVEEKPEENKFHLISIPDHELPPDKLKYKKLQIYQKQALELRRQKQKEREEEEQQMRELRENNPELYLHQLKEKYKVQYSKMKENERIKNELSNRKSKLKQRKMQAIARLAEEEFDAVSQNDDDWLAYKDLEESDHYSEIEAMEAELRQIDPEWTQAKDHHHLKQTNQLFLLTDLIRCHEIYFQPLLVGLSQIDLVQIITSVLSAQTQEVAAALLANIHVVGGGSVVTGLKERLERDLKRQCPVGSHIKVKTGKGEAKGAFLGMQYIGRHEKDLVERMSFKREEYLSKNGNIFVANPWSNPKPAK